MVKWLAISVLTLLLFGEGERYIDWNPDYKLNWDDFQGSPDDGSDMKAHTQTKLNVSWVCDEGDLQFTVQVRFDRERSWKKDLHTERLLAHEQGHFDITELYGRKMRKMLTELKDACDLSDEEFKAHTTSMHKEWGDYQKLYDTETDHGILKVEQEEWESKIAKQLEKMKDFAAK